MKNKYLVINKEGKVFEPKEYLKLKQCSYEMSICIRREVLDEKWESENKSDYLNIASRLGFSWEDHSQIGFVNYNYKADLIRRIVEGYARNLVHNLGMPIYEVKGSNFFDMRHPVVEAYANLFGDRLFKSNNMVMGYDASYPQFNLASKMRLKESDLPFAHFSLSDCYRYEQSGECMLLYRNRRFFMPDLHPYFKDIDQAWEWYPKLEKQLKESFNYIGKDYINIAKIGSQNDWNSYQNRVCEIAIRNNKEILVEIRMSGKKKYWIVDIDYGIIDQFEQFREIGCIQIDEDNAKRLGIKYKSEEGEHKYPAIIHAAIPGGVERFIYMLIDNYKDFPIDFQPVQLRIIPVSEKYVQFAKELVDENRDLRIEIDDRDESVGKRVKMAHEDGIPNQLIVGEKEKLGKSKIEMINNIRKSLNSSVPFLPCGIPYLKSMQIQ